MRQLNTTTGGGQFDAQTIVTVWNKARIVAGKDPTMFRKDALGASIRWSEYGTTTDYGWEIDHIVPVSKVVAMLSVTCSRSTGRITGRRVTTDRLEPAFPAATLRGIG